jgi:hypothetical protein
MTILKIYQLIISNTFLNLEAKIERFLFSSFDVKRFRRESS